MYWSESSGTEQEKRSDLLKDYRVVERKVLILTLDSVEQYDEQKLRREVEQLKEYVQRELKQWKLSKVYMDTLLTVEKREEKREEQQEGT